MNVDVVIHTDACLVGIGAIIQESHGDVKIALSKKIIGLYPSKVMKTKALDLAWVRNSFFRYSEFGLLRIYIYIYIYFLSPSILVNH